MSEWLRAARAGGRFRADFAEVTVLVECDTGAGRCGVQTPAEAVRLAEQIAKFESLNFGGMMTCPAMGGGEQVQNFMETVCADLEEKISSDRKRWKFPPAGASHSRRSGIRDFAIGEIEIKRAATMPQPFPRIMTALYGIAALALLAHF